MTSFIDRVAARLASIQHGVFTRRQLIAEGIRPAAIDGKLRAGTWRSLHPGVYCHSCMPQSWLRDQMAAVLWARPAAASGRAAAALHALPGFDNPDFEILTASHRISSRCGIVVHHTKRLPVEQVTQINAIPCTTVERTLLDLCGIVHRRRAAIAVDHALHRGLTTLGALDFCLFLTARRGRNGCATLRELVKARARLTEFPNSPLETMIFELLEPSPLPMPHLQVPVYDSNGRFVARPDFFYADFRLAIEGHSRLWHAGHEFELEDGDRHRCLIEAGVKVLYVSWPDAINNPQGTLAVIEKALRDAGWGSGPEIVPRAGGANAAMCSQNG